MRPCMQRLQMLLLGLGLGLALSLLLGSWPCTVLLAALLLAAALWMGC